MQRVYCIGGICGSGKTHFRERLMNGEGWVEGDDDDELSNYPLRVSYNAPSYDISDIYDEVAGQGSRQNTSALNVLLGRLRDALDNSSYEDVVLEALFKPKSLHLRKVHEIASQYEAEVVLVWCSASRKSCRQRVEEDRAAQRYSSKKSNTRRWLVNNSPSWCFKPISRHDNDLDIKTVNVT